MKNRLMYSRSPPTLSDSTGIVSILVFPRYCCSSPDVVPSPELPPSLLLLLLPQSSKNFATSSHNALRRDVLDFRGALLDGEKWIIAEDLTDETTGFTHFGTNASAPSGHGEKTSARTTQSESSRGKVVDSMSPHVMCWFCDRILFYASANKSVQKILCLVVVARAQYPRTMMSGGLPSQHCMFSILTRRGVTVRFGRQLSHEQC